MGDVYIPRHASMVPIPAGVGDRKRYTYTIYEGTISSSAPESIWILRKEKAYEFEFNVASGVVKDILTPTRNLHIIKIKDESQGHPVWYLLMAILIF